MAVEAIMTSEVPGKARVSIFADAHRQGNRPEGEITSATFLRIEYENLSSSSSVDVSVDGASRRLTPSEQRIEDNVARTDIDVFAMETRI